MCVCVRERESFPCNSLSVLCHVSFQCERAWRFSLSDGGGGGGGGLFLKYSVREKRCLSCSPCYEDDGSKPCYPWMLLADVVSGCSCPITV